jgi:hypothetical protein
MSEDKNKKPQLRSEFVKAVREQQKKMAADAAASGVDGPKLVRHLPSVDIGEQIGELADTLGRLMSKQPIFRYGQGIIAEDFDGEMKPMDGQWFCSWVEQWVSPERLNRHGDYVPASMGKDLAVKILAAGQFRLWLREIQNVRTVRLPVVRQSGEMELLPLGYDAETMTWTEGQVEYREDMGLAEAMGLLERWFGEWPWDDMTKSILSSASCAAVVGAMMGQFCDAMLGPGDKRPMFAVGANQAGSGKSTIVRMVLTPVHGLPGEGDLPEDKQELIKLLQTAAINRRPYLVLDDIGRFLKSPSLNRFITASVHSGRVMGGQQDFKEVNRTQVAVTGNNLEVTTDLARRSVISGLFVPGEIQGRVFRFPISDSWLARTETRAEMLSACWAVVKAAWEQGFLREIPDGSCFLQSFERWSALVQGCLKAARFTVDPLDAERARNMAATEETEMRLLLSTLGDEIPDGEEATVVDYARIIEVARNCEVFEWLLGAEGDPEPKPDVRRQLSRRLKAWFARHVPRKSDGKIVEFGSKRGRSARQVRIRLV